MRWQRNTQIGVFLIVRIKCDDRSLLLHCFCCAFVVSLVVREPIACRWSTRSTSCCDVYACHRATATIKNTDEQTKTTHSQSFYIFLACNEMPKSKHCPHRFACGHNSTDDFILNQIIQLLRCFHFLFLFLFAFILSLCGQPIFDLILLFLFSIFLANN